MNRLKTSLTILSAAMLCGASPLLAQEKRVSPHETISKAIDGSRVTVVYGRPYTKDPKTGEPRKIWGGVVPFGTVWRTGADEATLLITQQPLLVGETDIPAGAYSLYLLPKEDGSAELIINKQVGQWGTQYEEAQDLARVEVTKAAPSAPVDQFTITLAKKPDGGGTLALEWGDVSYTVPLRVKK